MATEQATVQDEVGTQDQQRTEGIATALLLAAIAHERFSTDMTARVMQRFAEMERELVAAAVSLEVLGYPVSDQKARMRELEGLAEDIVLDAYDDATTVVSTDLQTVAETSEGSVINALIVAFGPEYAVRSLRTVPVERLQQLADEALFEGATIAAWVEKQAADAAFRVRRSIVEAITNGADEREIIETIRGSRESRRTDGVFQQPKRNIEILIRTAVQAVAAAARLATYEANGDTIKMLGQHSILDSKTSDICIAYSGKRWRLPDYEPVGHSLPFNNGTPRHWRCRSSIVPLFGDSDVPGETYEDWLRTRQEDEQRDILGALKWQLWRSGRLSLSDLIDQRGNPLSASELTRRFSRKAPD